MTLPESEPITAPSRRYAVGIAVPARDEAKRIEACLQSLDVSAAGTSSSVSVTVLVNNSRDDTAAIARHFVPRHLAVSVVEVELDGASAHAGTARRCALDLCLARLPTDGVLMTTDADSCVAPDWIDANLSEIEAGADAVAGAVTFTEDMVVANDPVRALEWQLATLQARLHSLLDPRPCERCPTHIWAWGASLAVTVAAYRAVGGMPDIPLAEDRAFADLLSRCDFRVRRSFAPRVYTSPRTSGRAPGGLADLITGYATNPGMPCDAAIEPVRLLARRLMWRARLRRSHDVGERALDETARMRLAVAPVRAGSSFGEWWSAIQALSPRLVRERVLPEALAREIECAERLIARVERSR